MVFGSSITISTSDSLDIDNTYIETPTVTATPVNIIVKVVLRTGLSPSFSFSVGFFSRPCPAFSSITGIKSHQIYFHSRAVLFRKLWYFLRKLNMVTVFLNSPCFQAHCDRIYSLLFKIHPLRPRFVFVKVNCSDSFVIWIRSVFSACNLSQCVQFVIVL